MAAPSWNFTCIHLLARPYFAVTLEIPELRWRQYFADWRAILDVKARVMPAAMVVLARLALAAPGQNQGESVPPKLEPNAHAD